MYLIRPIHLFLLPISHNRRRLRSPQSIMDARRARRTAARGHAQQLAANLAQELRRRMEENAQVLAAAADAEEEGHGAAVGGEPAEEEEEESDDEVRGSGADGASPDT